MSDPIKKAALLLREGATMLPETCPICGSPLYKLKDGRIVCPIHGEIRKIQQAVTTQSKKDVKEVVNEVIDIISEKLDAAASKAYARGRNEAEELLLWLKALDLAINIKKKLE